MSPDLGPEKPGHMWRNVGGSKDKNTSFQQEPPSEEYSLSASKGFAGSLEGSAQWLKHLPTMQETRVRSPSWEDPLEKEMATHSSHGDIVRTTVRSFQEELNKIC